MYYACNIAMNEDHKEFSEDDEERYDHAEGIACIYTVNI